MRGGRYNFTPDATLTSDPVEKARAEHKCACETRLAQRMNTPKAALNTPWPGQKPGEVKR